MKASQRIDQLVSGAVARPAGLKSPAEYRAAYGAGSYSSYVAGFLKQPAGTGGANDRR